MSAGRPRALDLLRAADREIASARGPLASLDRARRVATPLAALGEILLAGDDPDAVAEGFAGALAALAAAQAAAFPGNLFWDLDLPAVQLVALARREDPCELGEGRDLLVALQSAFGSRSSLRFRYAHDFVYGFDWARWVRADPAGRSRVAPFDAAFLRAMRLRGAELADLVLAGDTKYPPIPGEAHRNPFGFRRDPDAEERLLRDLAERGLVPVEAWRVDAMPRADRDFSATREERAAVLGLGLPVP